MKPIEAGCLAIIINANYPGNVGKEVRVVRLEHMETLRMGQRVWSIEPLHGKLAVRADDLSDDFEMGTSAFSLERNLMRIDGGDPKYMVDKRINFLEVR